MAVTVDAFLRRYFREQERRASPRTVSFDGGGGSGHHGDTADDWWLWAIVVMGRARVPAATVGVLRTYYLSLANSHVRLIQGASVPVAHGEAVAPAGVGVEVADLQSFVSWSEVSRQTGVRRQTARVVWSEGRDAVARALAHPGTYPLDAATDGAAP